VHAVTYVEVEPTAAADAVAALVDYRDRTRKDVGLLRVELLRRVGQSHHVVIVEVWRDQAAFDAHQASAHAAELAAKLDEIRTAPIDQRVHVAVSSGAMTTDAGPDAVHVVTHVDVVPPRKDDGLAALKQLAEASRGAPGNVRFDVVQQTSRPNHFTVVEAWRDAASVAAHAMAEPTRRCRETLGPISGALYDERLFTAF
jgi:quinol monooxygenase YgiN